MIRQESIKMSRNWRQCIAENREKREYNTLVTIHKKEAGIYALVVKGKVMANGSMESLKRVMPMWIALGYQPTIVRKGKG